MAKLTRLWHIHRVFQGDQNLALVALHDRYGTGVPLSPLLRFRPALLSLLSLPLAFLADARGPHQVTSSALRPTRSASATPTPCASCCWRPWPRATGTPASPSPTGAMCRPCLLWIPAPRWNCPRRCRLAMPYVRASLPLLPLRRFEAGIPGLSVEKICFDKSTHSQCPQVRGGRRAAHRAAHGMDGYVRTRRYAHGVGQVPDLYGAGHCGRGGLLETFWIRKFSAWRGLLGKVAAGD